VEIFQGEEAKVVIVSLVRSNQNKKVESLKKSNRINVLPSRAQHGLCLIGNSETYSNIEIWRAFLSNCGQRSPPARRLTYDVLVIPKQKFKSCNLRTS
jgi:superfamily I DNA and/or RNA helicase